MPRVNVFDKLLDFLDELDKRRISYDVERSRADALMVKIFNIDEYWEVEFLAEGDVVIQIFKDQPIHVFDTREAKPLMSKLLRRYDEAEAEAAIELFKREGFGRKIRPRIPRKQERPRPRR